MLSPVAIRRDQKADVMLPCRINMRAATIAALVLLSESHLGAPVSTAADARVRTETRAHGVAGNRDAKVPQTNLLQTEENLFPVRHTN